MAFAFAQRALSDAGACVVCLKKAGIMYNHFPGEPADASDPSPILSRHGTPGVYPYARSYERGQFCTCAALLCSAHHHLWLALLAEQPSLRTSFSGHNAAGDDTACRPICAVF